MKLHVIALSLAGSFLLAGNAAAQDIYTANYGDGTVSVVDVATQSVEATVVIPGDCTFDPANPGPDPDNPDLTRACPEAVVMSQNGDFAYVALDGSSTVAMIDTATFDVTLIDVAPRFDPLIFRAPGTDRIYVTSTALDSTGQCGHDDGGDPDFGAYLNAASSISVIEGGTEIGLIGPIHAGMWAMGFAPDGETAYAVACSHETATDGSYTSFVRIDLDLDELPEDSVGHVDDEFELSQIGGWGFAIAVSPSGSAALITAGGAGDLGCVITVDLVLMEQAGSVCGFTAAWGVRFNALGNRAYVADSGDGTVTVLNTTTPLHPSVMTTVAVTPTGSPTMLRVINNAMYLLVAQEPWGPVPSEVVAFDITNPDSPVQYACSVVVGWGGFSLDVTGTPPPWVCGGGGGGNPEPRKVKGTGHLAGNSRIHFEFHAELTRKGLLKGQCNVIDGTGRKPRHFKCEDVTSLTVSDNTVTITGNGRDGKTPITYTIIATDNGKPGRGVDLFVFNTSNGYAAGLDTLRNGDIRIYPPKGGGGASEDDDEDEDDD